MAKEKENGGPVVALTLSGKKGPLAQVFVSANVARNTANGYAIYKTANEIGMDYRKVTVEDIFDLHNLIVPKNERWASTSVISTRAEAAWALWDAAIKYLPHQEELTMAKKAAAAAPAAPAKGKGKAAAAPAEPKERKERVSEYEGKTLYAPANFAEMPPLREGSSRFEAMAPVLAAGKKGIKFANWKGTTDNCTVSMLTKMVGWNRIEVR